MLRLINNENGTIFSLVIVIIIIFVALASSATLLSIVRQDCYMTQSTHDLLQEELLLRAEVQRTKAIIEANPNRPLPDRQIEIIEPDRVTTYSIDNKKEATMIVNFMGFPSESAFKIRSLATAKRGRRFFPSRELQSKRYMERLIKHQSLAQYQYFTDSEASENAEGNPDSDAGKVKFWGPDVFTGKVHSNSDIYIQQAGGGDNGGWPIFEEMVTTAGELLYHPTNIPLAQVAPMNDIFLGGYAEHVPPILFTPNAQEIRATGNFPIPDIADIAKIVIDGSSGNTVVGDIQFVEVKPFIVYSWVPDTAALGNQVIAAGGNWLKDSDSLWTNYIAIYDTVWSPGPAISLTETSAFITCELWIEGNVAGSMTYGCSDTTYITGDITYANTAPGAQPDNSESPNTTDYFGLVSEKKILVRYKHRDPDTHEICDANAYGITLYGAYAAIGRGDEAEDGDLSCHEDGIFTFQYHHRHGSTPNYWGKSPNTGNDTLFNYIDFHKYIFPTNVNGIPDDILGFKLHSNDPAPGWPTSGFPYEDPDYINSYPNDRVTPPSPSIYAIPYGTDWPWYNPVWPESQTDITWYQPDHPILQIFGAIAQVRRGFIHRSGTDPFNHVPDNSWDLDDYHYGGKHAETGYDKDYNYDQRFLYVQPPDYPQIYRGWAGTVETSFEDQSMFFKSPPRNGLY